MWLLSESPSAQEHGSKPQIILPGVIEMLSDFLWLEQHSLCP